MDCLFLLRKIIFPLMYLPREYAAIYGQRKSVLALWIFFVANITKYILPPQPEHQCMIVVDISYQLVIVLIRTNHQKK
ncbi:hypothetical protein HZS_2823 [Henneguya salminicola]|nr:hypothetical protein HZS_2823 [Henneguya salminicola]